MTKLKLFLPSIVVIAICSLALLFSPVHGVSPTGEVTLTQQEFKTLKSNLNELESTINNQLNTINELEMQLQTAKLTTSESNMQLIKALKLINEQKKELQEAKNSLQEQEKMLSEQKLSLAKAEVYLNEQKNELAKMKAKQRNSTLLNIALGVGVVYMAAK
ncbi:MAG: hypothetical protein SPK95_09275 [Veillonella caviae]|uniref:hypothetical protein n=1 Tax=Veillonella caviae TaxID=248316 RepID=UPI002A90FB43|nr:hypothetical protein [Veillonella caviae]MDY5716103.1 hypothetical protein [Veillonella caviae]